jgi:16S rRNA (cytosine967-C5)-methyltransferase
MISPGRRAAYEVVLRVFEQDAYADRVLRTAAGGLDARDRALAQRLAYGTIQRVRTLDHGIETLGRRPVRKLDPPVRAALRLGAYQLGFMETAPHAAVSESVELVRRARLERAVPFTNAVLRRLADGLTPLLDALPEATPEEAALRHSYPDWVARTWWEELGREDALALMRAQNEPPGLVVRLNPRRPGEVAGEPDPDVPGALHVERVDEEALAAGRIWPQSVASQLAGLAVGSREGERTLDLCAAPGGKATQLAGEVVAVEVNPGRARELRENVERLGATNVEVVEADALDLPPGLDGFDRALVDAPCSGLGVLARRPDLRWRAEPLPELQLALLRAAAARVRPGGTIVYSVCTINAAENEEVVDAAGLELEPLGEEWPRFAHPRRPGFLVTLPHVHRTSGFFVARLRAP